MTHIRTLSEIDAYPILEFLPLRVSQNYSVPIDFAEGLLREAKRMIFLAYVSGESVAPSDRVDWAWHELILCTRLYKDFAAYIGDFIHHTPNPPSRTKSPIETWEEIQATLGKPRIESPEYTRTKLNYERCFGMKPDPLYWP